MIATIVEDYFAVYPRERDELEPLSRLIAQFPRDADLKSRHNFVGHLTASGIVLSADGAQVLLLFHKNLRKFIQPGGHFDCGEESPIAAARREVAEETSLEDLELLDLPGAESLPFDINVHAIPANPRKGEPAHFHHDLRFLFRCRRSNAAVVIDLEESEDWRWVSRADFLQMADFAHLGDKLQAALAAR
ncbi:MAG: NUDIX domain-containing protein [Acidobacteriota bacterium]